MRKHNTEEVTKILKETIGIEEVLESLGKSLRLHNKGGQRVGDCPKCGKSNSISRFKIKNDRLFSCKSCGIGGGNAIKLLEEVEGYDFIPAREYLLDNFRPDLKEDFSKGSNIGAEGIPLDSYLYEELFKYGKELLYKKEGKEALSYLINERKYSLDNIKKTEWFFLPLDKKCREYLLKTIPNLSDKAKEYIRGKWIKDEKGKNKFIGLSLSGAYGDRFRLAFPYRDRNNKITGLIKRAPYAEGITVERETGALEGVRYCSSKGTDKSDLFNLCKYRRGEELLLVEGYPDAMYFHTLNIKTVALGAGAPNKKHFEGLKEKEVKSITISLDNDGKEKGLKHTFNLCKLAIEHQITCFVLPPEKLSPYKDLDEYFRGEGEEALKALIERESISAGSYLSFHINRELEQEIEKAGGKPTDKAKNRARGSILKQLKELEEKPILRRDFLEGIDKHFLPEYGVDRASLEEYTIRKREEELALLATKEMSKGNIEKAQEILKKRKELRQTKEEKEQSFEKLLEPYSEEQLQKAIMETPESIDSGYTIKGKKLLLPSGAITTFCALTSHGKTLFMNNIALRIMIAGKEVHIFNYEESREAILPKFLNAFCWLKGNRGSTLDKIKKYYKGGNRKEDSKKIGEDFEKIKEEFFSFAGKLNVHTSNYDIDKLVGAISFLSSKREVGAIFIDYFQLLRVSEESKKKSFAGYQEIKEIGEKLNKVAKETKLPIVLGAQFNRLFEKPEDMASRFIREAADIEHISNLICGLWAHWMAEKANKGKEKPELTIKVLKNRDRGGVGDTTQYKHIGGQQIIINEGKKKGKEEPDKKDESTKKVKWNKK